MAKDDYPYIRAWHASTGSSGSYVDDLIAKARRERAPADAIFIRHDGDERTWARIGEVTNRSEVERVERWLHDHGIKAQPGT